MKKTMRILCVLLSFVMAVILSVPAHADSSEVIMYRLYNPNSGEHFYTENVTERNQLYLAGWNYEGIAWYAPVSSSTPVYRLYNPNGKGEHHYTINTAEKDNLVAHGWSDEGIGWYSDDGHAVAVYRAYNTHEVQNNHNYTVNTNEQSHLISVGWNDEGICWYGCNKDDSLAEEALPERPAAPANSSSSSSSSSNVTPTGTQKYATPYGKRYHLDPYCGGKNSVPISDAEAAARGLTPCAKCAM